MRGHFFTNPFMIAAGYMFKKVIARPSWVNKESVENIYSVSSCGSEDFADYINYWKHNGYWLFNKITDMHDIIEKGNIDPNSLTLFYYEVFEKEYDQSDNTWKTFDIEHSFHTDVKKTENATLHGFDIVTFQLGTSPECSPLSCNSFADTLDVNQHCLFDDFSEAKSAIEDGSFADGEPGPFRIFAVYLVKK